MAKSTKSTPTRGNRVTIAQDPDRSKFNQENIGTFLEALMDGKTMSEAAQAINVGRRTPYGWMKQHPEFAKHVELANRIGCDPLEQEARRRGVEGWVESETEFFDKDGNPKGKTVVTKYDGRLLSFLMAAKDPQRFRQNLKIEGNLKIDVADRLRRARERMDKAARE